MSVFHDNELYRITAQSVRDFSNHLDKRVKELRFETTQILSTMTDDPTKPPRDKPYQGQAAISYDALVDLRHELAELRELLRSANCKARFMLAFSIFNLAALGVVVLLWVMS